MNATEFWTARGASIVRRGAFGSVDALAEPAAEARLAGEGRVTCAVPLLATTPLRIRGSDRAAFLHGQLSNAVQGLAVGACNHTLQLNARGQVLGEGQLCLREGDVFLAVEDGRGPEVLASLQAHIVFDDVQIEDLSERLTTVTVQGPEADAAVERAFGSLPEAGRFRQVSFGRPVDGAAEHSPRVLLHRRRRSPAGGLDVHLLAVQLPEAVRALEEAGVRVVGERALALMRVLGGVPSVAGEGAAAALPQELGLAHAVSVAKGCYLGQEIMARIEARGAVRKGLRRLRLAPSTGEPADAAAYEGLSVRGDGREVGRLGTVVRLPGGGLAALAILRSDLSGPEALIVVDGAGAEVARADPWPVAGAPGRSATTAGEGADEDRPADGVQPGGSSGPGL